MTINACAFYIYSVEGHGGAERRIIDLCNWHSERGGLSILLTLGSCKDSSAYPISADVVVVNIDCGKRLKKVKRVWRVFSTLMRYRPSRLVGFMMAGDLTVVIGSLLSAVPIVLAERNSPIVYRIKHGLGGRLKAEFSMLVASLVVVQQPCYRELLPSAVRNKVRVVRNPVEQRDYIDRAKGSERILFAPHRLDVFQKRIDLIIRAFCQISKLHTEWKLVIAGEGPDYSYLKRLVSDMGMSHKVMLVGYQTGNRLDSLYRRSNIFITASSWEGMSNSSLEALSYSLPSIVFSADKGVLDPLGGSCWTVEDLDQDVGTNDVNQLAALIALAIEDKKGQEAKGKLAHKLAKEYNEDNYYKSWSSILDFKL